MYGCRKCSRSGNHQPHVFKSCNDGTSAIFFRTFKHLNQLHINGGDCHEYGVSILPNPVCNSMDVETSEWFDQGSGPHRAANYIDDSVDVMEWQKQGDSVRSLPFPCLYQAFDLSFNIGMRCKNTLGLISRAAGIQNHCRACTFYGRKNYFFFCVM